MSDDRSTKKRKPEEDPMTATHSSPTQLRSPNFHVEPNIFNSYLPDDFLRTISDFLFEYIDTPNVEIEAKLGVLIDKNTRQRVSLPIETETGIHLRAYVLDVHALRCHLLKGRLTADL
jgi:hypothetical protein